MKIVDTNKKNIWLDESTYAFFSVWIKSLNMLSFDCETTGLMPFHGDRPFAITLSDGDLSWYIDCSEGLSEYIRSVFLDEKKLLFAHNAKFDMHQLREAFRLEIKGVIHDTMVGARLCYNDHISYSLDSCAARIGLQKLNTVEDYIKEHKLFSKQVIPGKKVRKTKKFFNLVPKEIMKKYACEDARITYLLGMHQLEEISKIDSLIPGSPRLESVLATERKITKVFAKLEDNGLYINKPYCKEAIKHHEEIQQTAKLEFQTLTGETYKDSGKLFAQIFEGDRARWAYTEKGNPSFESGVLERFDHGAARRVLTIRNSKSRADFFAGFTFYTDRNGIVHPTFSPAGTATGRASSSEPNFQNLTNDEESAEAFPVRRAIVPPSSRFLIVSFDYKQQEYALMLDLAGEMGLIDAVRNGADVHQATADLMGVSRRAAKTLNFMLLYGGGVGKLSAALGIPEPEARDLRALYFSRLPRVQNFIRRVTKTAETRGYVYNWAGRRFFCGNLEFSYVFPNRIIQGGGADIMKRAMTEIDQKLLQNTRSRMVLTVHDDLTLYMHRNELGLVPEIQKVMESVYEPRNGLGMSVDVKWSDVSLGDLKKGPFV